METQTKIVGKDRFEEIFKIMKDSFPKGEYRPKSGQEKLFSKDNYFVIIREEKGKALAFIAYWDMKDFAFVEHFAVLPEHREKGLGSEFLDEFKNKIKKPIVLEVENNENEIAKRRIDFYLRHSFKESDIIYYQPDLHKQNSDILLKLMYFENGSEIDLKNAEHTIFREIYGIEQKD